MHGLAVALWHAGWLAYFERDPAEVERCALDLIELTVRQNFMLWLAGGKVLGGWARSASGDTEGISWIDEGMRTLRATGQSAVSSLLTAKGGSFALCRSYLRGSCDPRRSSRTGRKLSRALAPCRIASPSRCVARGRWREQCRIEALFHSAISTAKQQKSLSLEKRARTSYAEYCRQKASA